MRSDDYLAHHGVLGMKWGVRKQRESSGSRSQAKAKKKADKIEAKKQKALAKADKKWMTTQRLKDSFDEAAKKTTNDNLKFYMNELAKGAKNNPKKLEMDYNNACAKNMNNYLHTKKADNKSPSGRYEVGVAVVEMNGVVYLKPTYLEYATNKSKSMPNGEKEPLAQMHRR